MDTTKSVSLQALDPTDASICASAWQCYQAGFAGEPWNEWKQCCSCSASYGLSIGETERCPQCACTLKAYWPIEQISSDIMTSLSLPLAYCSVAQFDEQVVGLALGYAIAPIALSEQLGIAIPSSHPTIAYQDEIVVHPDYQHHGIGRALYLHWMEWVADQGLPQVAARTLADPPSIVYRWYQRLGYRVCARYAAPDQRVILSLDM